MACPRCGNRDFRISKTKLLGHQPEVTFGTRVDDVVVYSYYCPVCGLREETSTNAPGEVDLLTDRWETVVQFNQAVTWADTGDPLHPYAAVVDGHEWLIRANDYPRQQRYTLIVNGAEVITFNHWPLSRELPKE